MGDPSRLKSLRKEAMIRLRLDRSSPSTFGSERSFDPPLGRHWEPGRPVGYYIDFSLKVSEPRWPPIWMPPLESQWHVATVQWGLGALERFLNGDGDAYLNAAHGVAEYLLDLQHREGPHDGGWRQLNPMDHTYRIDPPWLSGITQGEGASFFARLHRRTGDERYADAARRALRPMGVPVAEGGLLADLDGAPFVEEYPSDPPSFVLNGAIFSLWGYHDVHALLGDADAGATFDRLTDAMARNMWRFDTGEWSLYDLYPHVLPNLASPAYHLLHIKQLRILDQLAPRPQLEQAVERFERYRSSPRRRRKAVARKVAFRLAVPRNPVLAHRLPWNSPARRAKAWERPPGSETLVLCYHAVSEDWEASLSVTPERLTQQLRELSEKGYRGVTFSDAVSGNFEGKAVAITFDDAYRSVTERALPILERFGMPGTLFVPTDYLGQDQPMAWPGISQWVGGDHERELLPMSWEQVRSLADAGWEIGSHTRSHPMLTEIPDDRLEEELVASREECERRLERPCRSITYPYGDYDERVVDAAAAAGYSFAGTLPSGYREATALAFPRVGIYHVDDARSFRLKVSPLVRRLRRSALWGPVWRARSALSGRGGADSAPPAADAAS